MYAIRSYYAQPHAFEGDFAQAFGLDRSLTDHEHPAGVAVIAVLDRRDVEIDDVAVLQYPVARHAVADLLIDRGTDRFRIRVVTGRCVVERCRNATLYIDHVVMAEPVITSYSIHYTKLSDQTRRHD